jgi:hypothetical protein
LSKIYRIPGVPSMKITSERRPHGAGGLTLQTRPLDHYWGAFSQAKQESRQVTRASAFYPPSAAHTAHPTKTARVMLEQIDAA